MSSHLPKKPSIDLLNFPKLRQKSTHLPHSCSFKSSPAKDQQKNKSLSYFIPKPRHLKSLSKLEKSLSLNKIQFSQLSNLNFSKLNRSFLKVNLNKGQLQEKKKLQKRKVYTMDKQQFRSNKHPKPRNGFIGNPSTLNIEDKKDQIYAGPMINLDYNIEMSWLKNSCFDSVFSLTRTGASLSFKDDTLYLFGGTADSPQNNLSFHSYKLNSSQWHHINSSGQKPTLSLMYHTANFYKDLLIFIGGIYLQKTEIKKFNNPHFNIFNTLTHTWTEFHWEYYLKHHVSCMISNVAFIHGGLDERERTQNTIHMVYLNFNNLNYTKVNSFTSTEALSHHRMVTTLNDDSRLRSMFKIDGLIVFGGKKHNQTLSNQLLYLQTASLKLNDDDTNQVKKWLSVDIKGPKPEPRMCHTFDLLVNKGLCVLVGGINEKNQYLNDLWVLDLFTLCWTRIAEIPLLQQTGYIFLLYSGIAYHSSVVNDSQIYIYGGITKNPKSRQFYLIETQKFKRQLAKNQSRKKIDFSSNMISFKNIP